MPRKTIKNTDFICRSALACYGWPGYKPGKHPDFEGAAPKLESEPMQQ